MEMLRKSSKKLMKKLDEYEAQRESMSPKKSKKSIF